MSDAEEHEVEVTHKGEIEVSINWFWAGFVFVGAFFFWFWDQSGWYRVDCALHIERACDHIKAEYDKADKK